MVVRRPRGATIGCQGPQLSLLPALLSTRESPPAWRTRKPHPPIDLHVLHHSNPIGRVCGAGLPFPPLSLSFSSLSYRATCLGTLTLLP